MLTANRNPVVVVLVVLALVFAVLGALWPAVVLAAIALLVLVL